MTCLTIVCGLAFIHSGFQTPAASTGAIFAWMGLYRVQLDPSPFLVYCVHVEVLQERIDKVHEHQLSITCP